MKVYLLALLLALTLLPKIGFAEILTFRFNGIVGNNSVDVGGVEYQTTTVRNTDAEITFFCSKDNSYLEFWDRKSKKQNKIRYAFSGGYNEHFVGCQLGRKLVNHNDNKWMQINLDTNTKKVQGLWDPANPRISYPIGINCASSSTDPWCKNNSKCLTSKFIKSGTKDGAACAQAIEAGEAPNSKTETTPAARGAPRRKKSGGAN